MNAGPEVCFSSTLRAARRGIPRYGLANGRHIDLLIFVLYTARSKPRIPEPLIREAPEREDASPRRSMEDTRRTCRRIAVQVVTWRSPGQRASRPWRPW